ncbi:MAG: S41 family peptidase [Terriglobia bacterium]
MRNVVAWIALAIFLPVTAAQTSPATGSLLLQDPALSKSQIAFVFGSELWTVPREGGTAHVLATHVAQGTRPIFSPDGSLIAFSATYNGNTDVYVVPAAGGTPRRLTYHPGADVALCWTPDGQRILFRSVRQSYSLFARFFTIPVTGGFPTLVPLPMGDDAVYSPDGAELAYDPLHQWEPAWKRYRGGQTKPIWIAQLSDSSIVKVPRNNSNDYSPMWVGNTVYFLSDRNGPVSLFAYNTETKQVRQVLENHGLDFKSASAGPGAIVYEQFGSIHLYDLKSGHQHPVEITVAGDLPEARPHFMKIESKNIISSGISPTGQRAVFEAHGETLTVPAKKGDVRNLTRTPAVEERFPSWSPDGKSIAYFSDASGEYDLEIKDQNGLGAPRHVSLGNPPSFFYNPRWSPDSKKIAYTDKRLNVWYVDLAQPTPVKVDTDLYDSPAHIMDPVWSPDSRWIAYTKQLQNHLHAVFVYSLQDHSVHQITDGMSDALYPAFDKNGKYLYFTASTDTGLNSGWLDMTSIERPVESSVYVVVLRKDIPSPIAPESDEEKAAKAESTASTSATASGSSAGPSSEKAKEKSEAAKKPVKVQIDFENIGQRILALPIPPHNYINLFAGKTGEVFLLEAPLVIMAQRRGKLPLTLWKFDLKKRKTDKLLDGINSFSLSFDGKKMLYELKDHWFITGAAAPVKPGDGALKMDDIEVYATPRAEWKQEYAEVWRIERDFFYDPHFHGLNLQEAEAFYKPYIQNLGSRADLTYLFEEMTGNITVGHMFVRGGSDFPPPKPEKVGLLGADYRIANGRYQFARIFDGENWNPQLHAPLTQPGVNVKAGEYLLAVNGRELHASDNIYSFFLETAGQQTVLKVGPNPDGTGSRDVTVVPVPNEYNLRNLAWIESNRRKVDELSGGKLAYVYLPNTAGAGYSNFNRYYFAQVGKEGAVLDERFNTGGDLADYIIDYLKRPPMSRVATREGEDYTEPIDAIFGPKAMIINQFAGSGGDAMPWYFRKSGIGPLVGMRTWGGLVGIGGYPVLMDGGGITAPRWAIYGLNGHWEVENHGIPPDVQVGLDPKLVREGHDPQLEKAVEVVLDLLKKNPPKHFPRPPYPNYHQTFPGQ